MEYLSRILAHVTATMPFKFYPLCSQLKLSHLMFADDLLLFSKGDTTSIMILLRAFATFFGIHCVKSDIMQISGFSEGALPFKYLGVPISAGRLTVKNCSCLIEKITERIHGYAAKKLSYAGRLTLVNSVLTTLYTYWASIFILPKGVLRRIDALCRNYLWDGSTEYVRSPLDSLWVQWVHHIYMKDVPWSLYKPKHDAPWTWKTICKVKDKFIAGFPLLDCGCHVLLLKDKLFLLGIIPDDICFLCGSALENHQHLFTQCCYTRKLVALLSLKLNIGLPVANLLVWMQTKPRAKIKKQVTIVWIQALYYTIWHQRNKARIEGVVQRPEHVFQQIQCLLKCRFLEWHVCIKRSNDRAWFKTVTY
ncbi:uncharacterized protein LOC141588176 [Silene latifolia]|uniref:uncharacterized protein LOC141588176 n=1 Tax=Silene latifolia TaxID=37657 RepID=UPI003D76CA0C